MLKKLYIATLYCIIDLHSYYNYLVLAPPRHPKKICSTTFHYNDIALFIAISLST